MAADMRPFLMFLACRSLNAFRLAFIASDSPFSVCLRCWPPAHRTDRFHLVALLGDDDVVRRVPWGTLGLVVTGDAGTLEPGVWFGGHGDLSATSQLPLLHNADI